MTVVVVGEAVVDLRPEGAPAAPGEPVPFAAHAGGGPFNTAVALGRLGVPVRFAGRLTTAAFGDQLRARLTRSGVDLRHAVDAAEPATVAAVTLDERGDATYAFYVEGTADWAWRDGELPAAFDDEVAAVHTGSLAVALPGSAERIADLLAREHGRRTVSVDPNVRPQVVSDLPSYRERLEALLRHTDVVRASGDDVAALYPGAGAADVARRWRERGVRLVVVTDGAAGATAFHDGGMATEPVWPGPVVDTIGAGDAFDAGLLAGLAQRDRLGAAGVARLSAEDVGHALRHAARVAAGNCARPGADPPWAHELTLG